MARSAEDLRRELAEAERRERESMSASKNATQPKFRVIVKPYRQPDNGNNRNPYHKIYDPTVRMYAIERTCLNEQEAIAAGWSQEDVSSGGSIYLYNVATRRIICPIGGGTSYIHRGVKPPFGIEVDYADDAAFYRIGNFLAEYPGGGDITAAYEDFLTERRQYQEAVAGKTANGLADTQTQRQV